MGFLEKNLAALRQVNPKLADWLESEPDLDWIDLIQCPDQIPNLVVKVGAKKIVAYDMDDPWARPRQEAEKMGRFKENLSVLLGMGLGYTLRSIMEVMEEEHHIIVIEPVAHIIRLALGLHDYSEAISSNTLILAGPDLGELTRIVSSAETILCRGEINMSVENYANALRPDYFPLAQHVRRMVNQIASNNNTVTAKGMEIACNEIQGLPYTIRCRGVAELANAFKGFPAILVGTGPSLAKNIHHLKKAREKAVIIATGQALRSLLAYEVKPDFICTIDFAPNNATHFDGLLSTEDVPLVALCRAHPPLIRDYQGPIFVNGVPHDNHFLGQLWQAKGVITAGNSVAHLCFSLAKLIGADPVVLVGHDMAFSQTNTHFEQVDRNSRIEKSDKGRVVRRVTDPRCEIHGRRLGDTRRI
ncbi:MAG: motility associated factor glycosyltransferase family protein, partial [Deltaproteobacteria bacterium]|nr:motility associated factor glycosyltransferase family protein [Deltaproteobacteria bacterium]